MHVIIFIPFLCTVFIPANTKNVGLQSEVKQVQYGILGAPTDHGQPRKGTVEAPALLRGSGFIDVITEQGIDIKDYGNAVVMEKRAQPLKNVFNVSEMSKEIHKKTQDILAAGRIPITLGGDHTISIGTIAATAEKYGPSMGILWVDAHGDINTKEMTPSGNLHGMPLSFLLKELQPKNKGIEGFEFIKPITSYKRLAYIGSRDLDPPEKKLLKKLKIKAFTMTDIDRLGMNTVISKTIKFLSHNGSSPFHVSFDIDVMDPLYAPSTGTPVPGGLTLREGISLLESLHATGNVIAFDMTEVHPRLGSQDDIMNTVNTAKHLLMAVMGHRRDLG